MRLVPTKFMLKVTVVALMLILLLSCASACNNKAIPTDTISEFVSENKQQTDNQPNGLTHGKSLKTGDYIQLGSYHVEDEDDNPILWVVIDNNSHYAGYVNPETEHITLITAYIIDFRGFDAIEPENTNELRRGYGNGRYRTSNIRQWLNSSEDENNWWTAQNLDEGEPGVNNADAPPDDKGFPDFNIAGYEDKEGFLKSFTDYELEAILETTLAVGKNAAVDGGGYESVTDKVFLLSLTEVGLGDRSEYEEGKIIDFLANVNSRQAEATNACVENTNCLDKVSQEDNWNWWLRTPSPGFPASTFMVSSIGDALNSTANMSECPVGLRPALNLKTGLYFAGTGTKDDPYIIENDASKIAEFKDTALEEEIIDDPNQSSGDSAESAETKIIIEGDKNLSEGDKLLQAVCLDAAGNYPEWMINNGNLILWDGLDKNNNIFSIRQSPDYPSIGVQSPADKISGGNITSLDFINKDAVGYTVISENTDAIIGLIQFEFTATGMADSSYSYHEIYSKEKITSIIDISFLNKNEFLFFYNQEDNQGQERAIVSYINAESKQEEVLLEFEMAQYDENKSYNIQKVAVSPEGACAYIIYNATSDKHGKLAVFNLSTRKKTGEINNVSSAVWIGNNHILYSLSDNDGKSYIYDIKDNKDYEVNKIDGFAVDLSFCPKSGGVIIYNRDPLSYQAEAHALSCKNWEETGNEKNCIFNAIVDEDTVLCSRYDKSENGESADFAVWEGGYFSLKFKSGRHLCDEFSTNYQSTVLATAWNRY